MAWYSGTFYCGHEGYINIIGPLKNREKMREYKFSGLCPACCREALLQSRNEQNAAARKAAARMELPPLEGSRKQVTWAETLRVEALTRLPVSYTHLEAGRKNLLSGKPCRACRLKCASP